MKWIPVLLLCLAGVTQAQQVDYVIHISVDGGGSSYIQSLINANQLPNFKKFETEGAWTNNARSDYDYTVTLPNHTSQITGRGVYGVANNGHLWTGNVDPAPGQTIQSNKGSYVASVFDVAHDNGLRTAMYAGKSKFSLFTASYGATNGAVDVTGADNGRNKIDISEITDSATETSHLVSHMTGANPFNYAFLHLTDPDTSGHASGWGSTAYNNSLIAIDGYLGTIFGAIANSNTLRGHTAVVLTADHGGNGNDHSVNTDPLDYTIPFYVWGPGITAGADLYAINLSDRVDPGTGRPTYSASGQPIRNSDAANMELELLGLGAIPGSTVNANQDLVVPEPATMCLLVLGWMALARRRRR